MKFLIAICIIFFSNFLLAQLPLNPTPSPAVVQAVNPPPPVVAAATPVLFVPSPEQAPWEAPAALKMIMTYANNIPGVGPIIVEIMKWLGVIASIFTALVTGFFAITRTLSASLKFIKLVELAVKVDAFYVKYSPYLKFLSMYNVKKEDFAKKPS